MGHLSVRPGLWVATGLVGMLLGVSMGFSAIGAPPRVVSLDRENVLGKELVDFVSLDPSTILYQDGSAAVIGVLPAPQGKVEDDRSYYIVHTGLTFVPPAPLEKYGQLIDFVPGQFSLMRLSATEAEKIASELHTESIACGVLLKLRGDSISENFAATPTPRVPLLEASTIFKSHINKVSAASIQATVDKLTSFPTRFHTSPTGKQIADFLAEEYRTLAKNRNDVEISTYDHGGETPQKSLVVRIMGQVQPDEIIILGSHLDSVNWRGDGGGRSPGADDNASGTATNLEIFRILMSQEIKTDRTLEIHAYAAEEIGLVGSQDIAQDYKRDGKKVVAMVQHDMTLWKAANTPDKIWFVSNNTDPSFNTLLGKIIDLYVGVPWEQRSLSGGSSDHASWRRAGYATAFPFENPSQHNPAIHTARDTTAQSPYFELAAAFSKLGLGYVLHFGGVADTGVAAAKNVAFTFTVGSVTVTPR